MSRRVIQTDENYTLGDEEYAVVWSPDWDYRVILPDRDEEEHVPHLALRLMVCGLRLSTDALFAIEIDRWAEDMFQRGGLEDGDDA